MKRLLKASVLGAGLIVGATLCAQQAEQTLTQRAAAAAASADWPLAQQLYTELTAAEAENAAAWQQLGVATLNSGGDGDAAIAAFEKARELGFNPAFCLYGITRAHALAGDREAMLRSLTELADLGPSLAVLNGLNNNTAFAELREQPEFQAQLQRLTPCTSAKYREFDFWIGHWQVVNPQEQPVGSNTISTILDGCALTESWTSALGGKGFSINYYDNATDSWTQTYRDNTGVIANWPDLRGGLRDGAMVLENRDNPQSYSRWTWTRINADKVRQMAEVSSDGGENWQVVWDSYYLRVTTE